MEVDLGLGVRSRKKGSHPVFSLVGVCAVLARSLRVSNESVLPFSGQLWSACCARLWLPFLGPPDSQLCVFFPQRAFLAQGVDKNSCILRGSSWDQGVGGLAWEATCQGLTFWCWGKW